MSGKKKKNKPSPAILRLQRKLAVQQGFYDGRFRPKKIKDKKKEARKRWARKKEKPEDE
ncbi:MAG: hypothetical protein IT242_02500 [Bacteroidia bacterium]|nr:hypothetical protein [Bacteroidia bacterium]